MSGKDLQPKEEVVEGAPDWVVTFGDLMSLLLCFFVLLLSFSETDRQKYKEIAGAMKDAFGVQRKTRDVGSPKGTNIIARDFDRELNLATRPEEIMGLKLKEELATRFHNMRDAIEVDVKEDKVIIRLLGEAAFNSGESQIRPQMIPFLQKLGQVLNDTPGDVIVSGHTDNVPITGLRFRSNLELSIARAASVADFLLTQSRLEPKRLATMGFGKHRPLESNETEAGRRKNRRVEIILTNFPEKMSTEDKKSDGSEETLGAQQ